MLKTILTICIGIGVTLGVIYVALLNDILYWIVQTILIICMIYSIKKEKCKK